MAIRQLKTILVCLSLSVLCHRSADALASGRRTDGRKLINSKGRDQQQFEYESSSSSSSSSSSPVEGQYSRRNLFRHAGIASAIFFGSSAGVLTSPLPASAAATDTLDAYLYKIVRVREATLQERRLITTGKFKDTQRANVKLAVKFMVQNYRLSDAVVGASSYLSGGNSQQMRAIDTGQAAVQNLQTILEYFDSSDVENIKVGKNSMAGKEEIVVKGLEATQVKLDEFLAFFDGETLNQVKAQVQEENELNVKEFDRSLGDIINLPPPS